jgi:TDG/mug DNA glycosylase family protein
MIPVTTTQDVPDHLAPGLKLVIVGINPGLRSGATGHHYAYAGNHFWPLLYASGLLPEPLTFAEDARVLEYGIGLTNLCDRTSREANELSREEMAAGAASLRAKLELYRPAVVCFNGMGIYEAFVPQLRTQTHLLEGVSAMNPAATRASTKVAGESTKRARITPGLQPETLGNTLMYVVPSSSGRTAAYTRQAKLAYYEKLRELLEKLPLAVRA